ncbi:ATP-binding protein [Anaerovibrio sp. RM50]|uniref:ATP-binding protein n=1 Tax=Anaerovibrio sp. RM50 TaxID=1200557 RepID=UPI0004879672|nr:ATP-binding protein [Anaerovibrio sp. RM50]
MDSQESKKIVLDAELENLTKVNEFVEEFLKEKDCSPKIRMQLELVVEEIFSNIANYAYGDDTGKVTIEGCLEDDAAKFRLKFMDHGSPYNPLKQPDPDVNMELEDRPIGGLGIFLVKKNVDDITYQHEDGQNILTIVKSI